MASKKPAVAAKSAKNAAAVLSGETAPVSKNFVVPAGFKAKKVLTLPSLVMKNTGEPRILRIEEAIHVSKVAGKKLPDGTQEKPAQVCGVTDMESGEQMIFLVPAVVEKNITEAYPDDTYIGLTFYIENLGKRSSSQRYNDFKIVEMEAEEVEE